MADKTKSKPERMRVSVTLKRNLAMRLKSTCIEMDIQPYKLIESLIEKHLPEVTMHYPRGTEVY